MKAKSGTPTPTKGFSGQGQIFSARQQDYGYLNVQKQPTNYNTKSASFHQMNEIVKFLDATFDSLPPDDPPPEPSQQAWTDFAADYADVAVCGCIKEAMTGKKMFRVVNWNLAIQGSALILYPSFIGFHYKFHATGLQWRKFGAPASWTVELGFDDGNGPGTITWGIGAGVDNPQMTLTGANPQIFAAGTDDYETLIKFTPLKKYQYCLFNDDGVPAGAGYVVFSVAGP